MKGHFEMVCCICTWCCQSQR